MLSSLKKIQKSHLRVHEWLASVFLLSVFLILVMITSFSNGPALNSTKRTQTQDKQFEVILKGAVKTPGIYHFTKPIRMADLLSLAEVLPEANLKRLSPESMIVKSRIITIVKQALISIHVEGEVEEPGVRSVPTGTTLDELEIFVTFTKYADTESLKKKRRLKDGDVINVPSKFTKRNG